MHGGTPESQGLPDVESGFMELPGRYQQLKAACEAKVVSWRWASNDLYDPCPLYFERHRFSKGRFLRAEPADQDGKAQYGFGADGSILVSRSHVRFPGYPERLWCYETFYIHTENAIEVAHFDYSPDKRPISYARGSYEDGHLKSWQVRARHGIARETYFWTGKHVTKINVEHAPCEENGNHGPLVLWNQFDIAYAADGKTLEILCYWPVRPDHPTEETEVVYHRVPKGVTRSHLLQSARVAISEAVVDTVKRAGISAPVYSLVLAWHPGHGGGLPPFVGLGLEAERTAWIAQRGVEAKWFMWNPAEYQNYLDWHSEKLSETFRLINQECERKGAWTEAANVLNEVARELGEKDWSGILQTTQDFIAYAVDLELVDFRRNIEASAPPRLVKALEEKGWLLP